MSYRPKHAKRKMPDIVDIFLTEGFFIGLIFLVWIFH